MFSCTQLFGTYEVLGIKITPWISLVQGVIFIIVLFILNKILFRPTLKILHEREKKTEGFFNDAEDMGKRAEKTLEQYNEKLRQAKKEALELKRKFILEGTEKKEAILGGARKESHEFLEEMRGNIANEAESAKKTLQQQVENLGTAMAERALGRSV